ncbi:MAG: efflux RND transporter permease subunit, partial [Tepidisphaeraceae bacterium]
MWIVRLALRRPYTFVVAAMLVMILGAVMILQMPTDIFPAVNIPVIAVAFNYTGMSPNDMDKYIVAPYGRLLTTTVSDIDHFESQSLYGIGIIKIYFHESAKIEEATAQVTAISQTAIRQFPTGTQPPLIIRYDASDVPILQLSLSSDTMPEQTLFDQAVNQLRPRLVSIEGVQIPYPYGGKQRQMMVDLDPDKLASYGISPGDISTAVNNQNVILPAGISKIGTQEDQVHLNSSPDQITQLNDIPVKTVNDAPVYLRDVAHVRDGFLIQTNVVDANGKRGVLLSILKSGGASTIRVVDAIKAALPQVKEALPKELKIAPMFDQSLFVRAAVEGVVREAAIAAGLTAMMILIFLGSWRSTVVVMVSIPLSILVSIICLAALGQTLNVMTLGGMALAVGILVDDATVEIENIHRNLHQHKRLVTAILDGASQIAIPAFVSTLCICIVFVPVVFISGAAKYLFTPLAMAVVFAMLTSYLLSRTLVPTMVRYLLVSEIQMYGGVPDEPEADQTSPMDPRKKGQIQLIATLAAVVLAAMFAVTLGVLASPMGQQFPWAHDHILAVGQWISANRWDVAQWVAGLGIILVAIWLISKLNLLWRFHHAFDKQFEKVRLRYGGMLDWALDHRTSVVTAFVLLTVVSCILFLAIFPVGTDFFPQVDAGQFRLHVRCPPGTRVEQSEVYFAQVEGAIRQVIPPKETGTIIENIGIPNSSINLCLSDGSQMSAADGEILVSLNQGHKPTDGYQRELRKEL